VRQPYPHQSRLLQASAHSFDRTANHPASLCHTYCKTYRTWLLSEAALTAEEQGKALEEYGQRPHHLDALLESDEEKYEAQLREAEGEEGEEEREEEEECNT